MRNILKVFSSCLFANQSAIITGGAGGIGRQVAIDLIKLGCNVTITSRQDSKLQTAVSYISDHVDDISKLHGTIGNVKSEADVRSIIESAQSKFGCIDHLVNMAGGQFLSPAANIPVKAWRAVVETNLTGTFLMSKNVYSSDMKRNGGNIINITSSDMSTGTIPGMSHSSAARAGVENLTKSLALEWARDNVRVNCVAPGLIYTELASSNYKLPVFDQFKKSIPIGRLGEPEDVSGIVCFLLSPAASFFTGETIRVDGASSIYTGLWVGIHDLLDNS